MTEQQSKDANNLPPARRRQAQRRRAQLGTEKHSHTSSEFPHKLPPSFDFYLLSSFAGVVICVGLLVDSTALLVLGSLIAPLMTPVVGLSLGILKSDVRIFARSIFGLLISCLGLFFIGFLTGFSAQIWSPMDLSQTHGFTQLSWDNFLVLAFGAILTSSTLVRSGRSARVPSVGLAYQLFIPLAVAGLGLGAGNGHLLSGGLFVFVVHTLWALILSALTLAICGYRPSNPLGFIPGGGLMIIAVMILIGYNTPKGESNAKQIFPTTMPTATITSTSTTTPSLTPSPTSTNIPPTETISPTITPSLATQLTDTPSSSSTPSPARIDAPEEFGGAFIRAEPSFNAEILASLTNGTLIHVVSGKPIEQENATWVKVITPDGTEGWMVKGLMTVATPPPDW